MRAYNRVANGSWDPYPIIRIGCSASAFARCRVVDNPQKFIPRWADILTDRLR